MTTTVVIAEDDEGHATLVSRNLQRAGLATRPILLRDGHEALDYMHRRGPWFDRAVHDGLAMVMDLNMPRLGGLEVLRQMKADDTLARIPVFVLTTTDNPSELERCYALGAAACIVKPVDAVHFSQAIQSLAQFLMTATLPAEPGSRLQDHVD